MKPQYLGVTLQKHCQIFTNKNINDTANSIQNILLSTKHL